MKSTHIRIIWITISLIVINQLIFIVCENHQLHNFMDKSELEFYFNTNEVDKINLNDYDITDLHIQVQQQRKRRALRPEIESENGNDGEIHSLKFNTFDRKIQLELKKNMKLISPHLDIWRHKENNERELFIKNNGTNLKNCYYLHRNENSVAALNNCDNDDKYHGLILTSDDTLEIQPLNSRLKRFLKDHQSSSLSSFESGHLIKRVRRPEIPPNLSRPRRDVPDDIPDFSNITLKTPQPASEDDLRIIKKNAKFTVELGLFFDEAAYKIFSPHFNNDDRKLTSMILSYMNGVQALYHHGSLAQPIDITITRLEVMRRQPPSLPAFNGERDNLLDSFCSYQMRLNAPVDTDEGHWDIGLYLSGLDFYAYESGRHNSGTMGLATVRGVCTRQYNCVITEFGTTNSFRRPYPSAGFNSLYISAHEIGHNLGMQHDGTGNHCSRDGYIMSASRGTQGETTWSTCSSDVIRTLGTWATCLHDHPRIIPENYNAWRFQGYPGMKWSAKSQCELLLIDKDAMDAHTNNLPALCQNLQCRSPHRSGFFFAGPALEGTDCGHNNWCEGGYCAQKKRIPQSGPIVKGGWSPWKKSKCASGCMVKSKGALSQRRECDSPRPLNTNEGCDGPSYDVTLCGDDNICRNVKRRTPVYYASNKCKQFSQKIPEIDPKGVGIQAPHESNRLWMGCAIFCRRKATDTFYTPRLELNDVGIDAYFPDGTWCHSSNGQNFFCLQHHCLPENFQLNKNTFIDLSEDVPISGNANPTPLKQKEFNRKLIDYLSLDKNGRPIRTHITREDVKELHIQDRGVDDVDYRIVPNL